MCPLGERVGTAASEERTGTAQRKLERMNALLTDDQRPAIADVACFNMIPNWFYVERLKLKKLPEDVAEREALISGLDALG
jgi:hypothetical protein